jgi:LysR family glycine cleavage system transcriptional activator
MKLPPLNALRAFDAVLRLGGVRAAAEALFVTPGAVTQQMRVLEQHFGRPLLERQGRGVIATEAGRTLHANTSRHLRAIAAASESLRSLHGRVRVTAAHSVATRWLVPHLRDFSALHPEAEVMLDASAELLDLQAGAWDLALREGNGRYPDLQSEFLFPLDLVPVAAPGYVQREMRNARTRWQRARLLHDVGTSYWQRWLDSPHAPRIEPGQGTFFSNTALAIAAAIDGQGVAMASPFLIREELEAGALVKVDSRALVTGSAVHLVWPEGDQESANARAFRQWLTDIAAHDRAAAAIDGRIGRSKPERSAQDDDTRA